MLGLEPLTKGDEEECDKVQHKNSARLLSPPRVRKYVLMSVAGSFTDFHVDFGGTSVWYHVLRGAKRMYLAPPTEKNLDAFKRWTRGSQREKTFAEYLAGKVCAVDLHEGDTLIIPSGWIHAVYTPVDSMVFGGNFLNHVARAVAAPNLFCGGFVGRGSRSEISEQRRGHVVRSAAGG